MKNKSFKQKIIDQKPVVGCWNVIASPTISEILAMSGMDYIIIDLEHGPMNFETAENMVRAAQLHHCAAFIRVPCNDESYILRAVEIGADGIVVPQIGNVNDAERAVKACYYYPKGKRGLSPFTRSAGYNPKNPQKKFQDSNQDMMTILLVEGLEGLQNLDQILLIPNIHVVYLGTYDLSQAAGFPGEPGHPKVQAYAKEAIKKIRKQNISVGMLVQTQEEAQNVLAMGVNLVAYSADTALLLQAAEKAVDAVRLLGEDVWQK